MQQVLTNRELLRYLKNKHIHASFLNRLKLHYRPLICPYISLINMVNPGDRVGDIGCGSGQFLLLLSEFAKPSFLFGIEIHQRLIDNARELITGLDASRLDLEVYDGMNFPGQTANMDIIFLIDVLHHIPRAKQVSFLTGIVSRIRKGATLVVKDIDAANPLVVCNKLHDLIVSHEIGNELSSKSTADILETAGMEISGIQKKTTYVYPHYTVIAKKP
jgi:SAM-dependent methyltransferase